MENEIQDIIRQLRALADRLEDLVGTCHDTPALSEPEPAPTPTINFTLNDRYRFLRELFGNSAQEMKATVDALEHLASERDTLAFIATLGWDSERAEVKDFIAVVTERFKDSPTLLA